jgi:hypothetical protein
MRLRKSGKSARFAQAGERRRSVGEDAGLDHPIKIERQTPKDCSRKIRAADIYFGKDVMVVEMLTYAGRSRIQSQKSTRMTFSFIGIVVSPERRHS